MMRKLAGCVALLLLASGCGKPKSHEETIASCQKQLTQYKRNAVCSTISMAAEDYRENEDPMVCMKSTPTAVAGVAEVGIDQLAPYGAKDGCFTTVMTDSLRITADDVVQIVRSGDCGSATNDFLTCRRHWER